MVNACARLLKDAVLHEVIPSAWKDNGAALGFVLASASGLRGPCLWVQAGVAERDMGTLFGAGLHAYGLDPNRFMTVHTDKDRHLLGVMEEGLTTPELAAVIGVLPAASPHYGLTASRRLALRAQKHGVPAFLLRYGTGLSASAAYHRWQVSSAPSAYLNKNISETNRPLLPCWHVDLSKSRTQAPAQWMMSWNHETHCLCVDALFADRAADPARAPAA